jgi:hypothetical protein
MRSHVQHVDVCDEDIDISESGEASRQTTPPGPIGSQHVENRSKPSRPTAAPVPHVRQTAFIRFQGIALLVLPLKSILAFNNPEPCQHQCFSYDSALRYLAVPYISCELAHGPCPTPAYFSALNLLGRHAYGEGRVAPPSKQAVHLCQSQ